MPGITASRSSNLEAMLPCKAWTWSCIAPQAMSQMLPTLGLTAACLEERLCSRPQSDADFSGVTEAAELDAAIDAMKVCLSGLHPETPCSSERHVVLCQAPFICAPQKTVACPQSGCTDKCLTIHMELSATPDPGQPSPKSQTPDGDSGLRRQTSRRSAVR